MYHLNLFCFIYSFFSMQEEMLSTKRLLYNAVKLMHIFIYKGAYLEIRLGESILNLRVGKNLGTCPENSLGRRKLPPTPSPLNPPPHWICLCTQIMHCICIYFSFLFVCWLRISIAYLFAVMVATMKSLKSMFLDNCLLGEYRTRLLHFDTGAYREGYTKKYQRKF